MLIWPIVDGWMQIHSIQLLHAHTPQRDDIAPVLPAGQSQIKLFCIAEAIPIYDVCIYGIRIIKRLYQKVLTQ